MPAVNSSLSAATAATISCYVLVSISTVPHYPHNNLRAFPTMLFLYRIAKSRARGERTNAGLDGQDPHVRLPAIFD